MSVDVTSSRPDAVLERRVSVKEDIGAFLVLPWRDRSSTWEQVCVAPCRGADLDRYSTYRVAEANGISGSSPFTLPQGGDSVSLRLDAGNKFAHHAGIGMGAAGVAALIVGGSLLVLASDTDQHDPQVRARAAGFITGGAGIVFLAVGLPLAILTGTKVYADEKPVRAASTKPRFTATGLVF